jgi:hypothetical protein
VGARFAPTAVKAKESKEVTRMNERFWASGHWQVKEGKAEEFIQQWKEWLS